MIKSMSYRLSLVCLGISLVMGSSMSMHAFTTNQRDSLVKCGKIAACITLVSAVGYGLYRYMSKKLVPVQPLVVPSTTSQKLKLDAADQEQQKKELAEMRQNILEGCLPIHKDYLKEYVTTASEDVCWLILTENAMVLIALDKDREPAIDVYGNCNFEYVSSTIKDGKHIRMDLHRFWLKTDTYEKEIDMRPELFKPSWPHIFSEKCIQKLVLKIK